MDISESAFLLSNYIISGSGEIFNPYRRIENNSMFIVETKNLKQKYALHERSHYISVGINFSESMIDKYVVEGMRINKEKVFNFFLETRNSVTSKISIISNDIINCKLTGIAAKLFFEEKAKEWLRISIEAYEKKKNKKKISEDDKIAIERAAKYIDDHYFMNIKQSFLEEITYMSGTKLKSVFKERYNMSITEYTQRKRMDVGENLLVTTDLEIRDIAKAVGYKSHSRFTTLFKRYKGIFPKDVKKLNRI